MRDAPAPTVRHPQSWSRRTATPAFHLLMVLIAQVENVFQDYTRHKQHSAQNYASFKN